MITQNIIRFIQARGEFVKNGHWKMFHQFPKNTVWYAGTHSRCVQYINMNGLNCFFVDGVQVTDHKLLLDCLSTHAWDML